MPTSEELERKIQESCKKGVKEEQARKSNPCAVCGGPAHPGHHTQGR